MSSVDSITITSVSTVNQITITDTSGITVTTVGTQGLAGPSAIMGRGIDQNTAGASNNGALLVYDNANVTWTANDTTEGKQLTQKVFNLQLGESGATVTTILDEDDFSSDSATALATQQSIKAYIGSQITLEDLDITDGSTTIAIDLDSETLGLLGGTGISSTASGNNVTFAVDATVVTLSGTQTLTNKTLTSPTINSATLTSASLTAPTLTSPKINGSTSITTTGTEINVLDGDTSASSVVLVDADQFIVNDNGTMKQIAITRLDTYFSGTTATLTNKTLTSPVLNGTLSGTAFKDEDNMASNSATAVASQQSIKAFVESQVTVQDLDVSDGSNDISIDLDSETLTLAGGTGVTSTASGNSVTFAIGQAVGTSDNVVFNQVTSALVGNASTATALATARTISGVSFDGTANITLDTDNISEGSNNLYFTNARVQALSIDNIVEDTSPQLGGNLDVNGQDIISVSNGNITLTPNGTGVVRIDGSTGVDIQQGSIKIKNGGTQSYIDFYCEVSNAHYLRLQAPAHATFSGNPTVTLPNTAGTIALTSSNITGNAATSSALQTARAIALAGDVVGTANFDGSAGISITTAIQPNSVALATDTTGNFVAGITGTTNEIDVSGSGSENATVTLGLPDDVTISNDLTVSGNLTVTGTTTQTGGIVTDSNFQGFTDNNTGNVTDFGFYGKYVESSTTKYAGLFYDASTDNTFRLFTDTQSKPTTTVNTGATGYTVAGLVANLTGNVTGNVTGNSDTATALANARTIALSGDVTASGVSFDGTGNITLSTTIGANSVALGTDTTGNYVAGISGTSNEIEVSGSGSESSTVTIGLPDNVTITGNLTVNGTTTTVNTSTLEVEDPLIKLAKANSGADSVDIGFYGLYDTSGSQDLYAGLFRDANDSGKFKLFKDLQTEPTTTVNTSGTGYAVGTLVAGLEGDVVGNLTGTIQTAAQSNITSLGTLNALQVDNININGNTISSTAGTDLNITPLAGQQIVLDGAIVIDAGVVTGATSITSTAFVGDVTGNVSGTAATVTGAAQSNITSLGTLTALQVDNININGNTISSTAGTDLNINPLTGQQIVLDETIIIDAGVVTGATSITSTAFVGALTGNSSTATALANSRNFSISGDITASAVAFDGSGNVTLNASIDDNVVGADQLNISGNGTAGQAVLSDGDGSFSYGDASKTTEQIQDIVGGMVSSNTETGITVTYEDGDGTLDFVINPAQTTITSLLATDIKIGEDDQTKIDFGTADEIHFFAGNQNQIKLTNGALVPATDDDVDLGTSSAEFKNAFFDGTVTSDAFAGSLTGDVTGNASTATALETARTIGGTSFDGTSNISVALADTTTALATARNIGGVSFDGTANIDLAGVNTTGNQDTTGNAATATKLATARTIGGTSFDGSANIAVALASTATTLANARTINGVSFDGSANITTLTAGTGVSVSGTAVSIGQAVATSDSPTFQNLTLSGTDSIKVPAGTTGQRNGSPVNGMFRYNSTNEEFEGYQNGAWGAIAGGGASAMETNTFTGDGSTRAFTISSNVSNEDDLIIFIDGVFQNKADFVASGTTVTLDTAPVSGRKVVINHIVANIAGSSVTQNAFTGDGSTVAFTLSISPTNENNTQIYIDGVYQHKSTYTVSGTTLTFDTAPVNNTAIDVIMFSQTALNTPASDTVTTSTIADANVTSAKLASNAVTTVKITDANVTTAKLASSAVTTVKLGDNAVTTIKITDGNVTTAKIADSAITSIKIADGAVNTSDIADDAVTSAKLDTNIDIAGTLDVTGATTLDSTLSVSGNITGTLATAAQPNITSLGTLTSFRSTGIDDNADALAITIDNSENVGIGIDSPTLVAGKIVHIHGTASGVHLTDTASGTTNADGAYVAFDNPSLFIQNKEAGSTIFETSGTERMRIDSSGNLLLGTTTLTPNYTGGIRVHSASSVGNIRVSAGAKTGFDMMADSGGNGYLALRDAADMSFFTNDTERMRIDSSGNVGIANISPSSYSSSADNLVVGTSGDTGITIVSGTVSNGQLKFADGTSGDATGRGIIDYNHSSDSMAFKTAATERMRVTDLGKVAINTTGLNNSFVSTGIDIDAGTGVGITINRGSDGDIITFKKDNGSGIVGGISITSTSTSFNTSSDARLKDVTGEARGLEVINQLNAVSYNWKADGKEDEGLIAQEVMEIVPNAVTGSEEEMYQMDYSKLVTPLIKAIQEQQEQIETLKAEVKELKDNG